MDENNLKETDEEVVNVTANTTSVRADKIGYNVCSLIFGIIGLVCVWCWYISLPSSIMAIIFSVAGAHDGGRGMGIAGLVLGIIALALRVVFFGLIMVGVFLMNYNAVA